MYHTLKKYVKNHSHLQTLRHLLGVPAEDPPNTTFRDSLIKGEVPKNIDEMKWNPPMIPLLLKGDTRVAGAKILLSYFLGNTFPVLNEGLFKKKHRTSSLPSDHYKPGPFASFRAEAKNIQDMIMKQDHEAMDQKAVEEMSKITAEVPPVVQAPAVVPVEPKPESFRIVFDPPDLRSPKIFLGEEQIGLVENVVLSLQKDSLQHVLYITIGGRPVEEYPEEFRDLIRDYVTRFRRIPGVKVITNF